MLNLNEFVADDIGKLKYLRPPPPTPLSFTKGIVPEERTQLPGTIPEEALAELISSAFISHMGVVGLYTDEYLRLNGRNEPISLIYA